MAVFLKNVNKCLTFNAWLSFGARQLNHCGVFSFVLETNQVHDLQYIKSCFVYFFIYVGVSPAGKPSPGTPTTPNTNLAGGLKTSGQTTPNSLANILSKVEFTPESILSVLSKTQVPAASNLQGKVGTAVFVLFNCISVSFIIACQVIAHTDIMPNLDPLLALSSIFSNPHRTFQALMKREL